MLDCSRIHRQGLGDECAKLPHRLMTNAKELSADGVFDERECLLRFAGFHFCHLCSSLRRRCPVFGSADAQFGQREGS